VTTIAGHLAERQLRTSPIDDSALDAVLDDVKDRLSSWLRGRRAARRLPFGRFKLCEHAFADDELNAATTGIELWVMLGLPMTQPERRAAIAHLSGYQTRTGLVVDPTWRARRLTAPAERLEAGDPFFTVAVFWALRALGARLSRPVGYLAQTPADIVAERLRPLTGAHDHFAIGDCAALIEANESLGVPGAGSQRRAVFEALEQLQDRAVGLWSRDLEPIRPPYPPAVNLGFHVLRSTYNVCAVRPPHVDRMIDTCLAAADDVDFYGWGTGLACNDLDLALVLHTAASWSAYRHDEVARWARERLPVILAIQKPDGGFSFHHTHAMTEHGGFAMSPGRSEGDGWGSLMYANTVKMMVELGYPRRTAPWRFGQVHKTVEPPTSHDGEIREE
jgi:hypothetical protein